MAQSFGDEAPDAPEAEKLLRFVKLIRKLTLAGCVKAYHDKSDGGLAATLAEMMFATHKGVTVNLDSLIDGAKDSLAVMTALFNEEIGAAVQIPRDRLADVEAQVAAASLTDAFHVIGSINEDDAFVVNAGGTNFVNEKRTDLMKAWSEVSHEIARRRDNPACADSEFNVACGTEHAGLYVKTTFNSEEHPAGPYIHSGHAKPKLAVLREQGVNSQMEMAAAFTRAGFEVWDVHMTDLLTGRVTLEGFKGLAAAGGFSYGDVLGAGGGWAKTILFNERLSEMFGEFFARPDTFSLGVCNGCQMLSRLKSLIPGA